MRSGKRVAIICSSGIAAKGRFFHDSDISKKMGRLVTRQTMLVLFYYFLSHLNLGACAGFALSNCDWLGRTIAVYQVFFQQGRVALGKWCIGPQKGHPRTPAGWSFFVQFPGLIFSAWRWSGPATSASMFSVFLDYILRVCQSLWDSFLYLGKLHWFLYLLLFYFYDPGMFVRISWKKVCWKGAWSVSYLVSN